MRIADYEPFVSNVTATGVTPAGLPALAPVNIPAWDYRSFTHVNGNATQVVYKRGGQNGTIVATQNLTWSNNLPATEEIIYP